MTRKLIYILSLAFTLAPAACTEQIDIELGRTYTRLVVDGGITDEQGQHQVRLTLSTSYFHNQDAPAVRGAKLQLSDGDKVYPLAEVKGGKGTYLLPRMFTAIPARNYTLSIRLKESIGGEVNYHADTEMPDTRFRLDSIAMEYNDAYDFWLVKVYAEDPPTRDFYKFDTYLNGINGNDTTSRTTSTHDRFFNGMNTNGFAVAFFDGDILYAGDTISMVMSALTEDHYQFYSELNSESGFRNPLFSGPPANIRSNLQEGGLGYFYARKVKRAQLIVPKLRKK